MPPTTGSTRWSFTSWPKRAPTSAPTVASGSSRAGSTRSIAARALPRGDRSRVRASCDTLRGMPSAMPSGSGCIPRRWATITRDAPSSGARSEPPRPSDSQSASACPGRVRNASGPSSTVHPSRRSVRTLPPTRPDDSSTTTSASGCARVSAYAAVRPARPPPTTTTRCVAMRRNDRSFRRGRAPLTRCATRLHAARRGLAACTAGAAIVVRERTYSAGIPRSARS